MKLKELKKEASKYGYKLVRQKIPVPPSYRRNRKQEFLNFLLMFVTCLGGTVVFYFLLIYSMS